MSLDNNKFFFGLGSIFVLHFAIGPASLNFVLSGSFCTDCIHKSSKLLVPTGTSSTQLSEGSEVGNYYYEE